MKPRAQQMALTAKLPAAPEPPPWAYDYSYNDALCGVEAIPKEEVFFPSYYCDTVEPVVTGAQHSQYAGAAVTTQTYCDTVPITYGKYKGQRPCDIAKHSPDYIVWCQDNLPESKWEWSQSLYEECKQLAENMPKFRR